jgi:hypothetical protein
MPHFAAPARAAVALLALVAACGRGENQSADRNGADTTSADRSATGPLGTGVGDNKPAMDSGFAAASQQLDSLNAAGHTPAQGIDSAAARVQSTTANESGSDTSRLNNRVQPRGGTPAGARRP